MSRDLYYHPAASYSRSIQMLAKSLGVDLNLKQIDFERGDHKTPEYLKVRIVLSTRLTRESE